jgi:hypothetical protein
VARRSGAESRQRKHTPAPQTRGQVVPLPDSDAALRAEAERRRIMQGEGSAITPPTSDIVPPGELGDFYVGGPRPGPDDRPRPTVIVIEGEAVKTPEK